MLSRNKLKKKNSSKDNFLSNGHILKSNLGSSFYNLFLS